MWGRGESRDGHQLHFLELEETSEIKGTMGKDSFCLFWVLVVGSGIEPKASYHIYKAFFH